MISKIEAKNFMAYESVSIDFEKDDHIVNIVGDNGAGKSSLLEIIPFTIFGESRVPFEGLIKHGANYLQTEVIIHNEIPGPVHIIRHRKRSDSSSVLVVNYRDNIVGEDHVYKNREATDFLSGLFGMDYFIFSLISYFGLGSGDQIVTSGTKTRITYLQRIANIAIYLELAKRATKAHRHQRDKFKEIGAAINEMKFMFETEYQGLDEEIYSLTKERKRLDVEQVDLMKRRGSVSTGRDRIHLMTIEKKKLEVDLVQVDKTLENMETDVKEAEEKLIETGEQKEITIRDTYRVRKFLAQYSDGLSLVDNKIGQLSSKLELLNFGLTHYEDEGCPLCGEEIDDEVVEEWQEDADKFEKLWKKLSKFRETLRAGIELQRSVTHVWNDVKNHRDHLALEFRTVKTETKQKRMRLKKITTEITNFYDKTRLDEIERELNRVNSEIANNKALIATNRRKVKRREEWKERMTNHEHTKSQTGLRMDVASILLDIFSQKGIPLQLLRDMCMEIELESTEIYKQFDHGEVVIRGLDAEDGKLDVSFFLETQSGVQSYAQLSAGQRTLLLLCVRLALANICFRNHSNTHLLDFVVLDEITTYLSETKIESLTRVLVKMLKTTFTQLFVISHTPLPNLQPDVTLSANIEFGDSKMESIR